MCTRIPFFGEIISRNGVQPELQKLYMLTEMLPLLTKRTAIFLGIKNYLEKFSLVIAEICKPLRKLTSPKSEWTWTTHTNNHMTEKKQSSKRMQPSLFLMRTAVPRNRCIGYRSQSKSSACEGWNLVSKKWSPNNAALWPIAFVSKSLTSTETWHSYIQKEALDILHGLEKCHDYCFPHEVSMIGYYRLQVAV